MDEESEALSDLDPVVGQYALTRSDYQGIAFTDAEWREMIGVFPGGVCDDSKPGVNQGGSREPFSRCHWPQSVHSNRSVERSNFEGTGHGSSRRPASRFRTEHHVRNGRSSTC